MGCFELSAIFEIYDTLILALYTIEFIIALNPQQFMMWCDKILTNEDGIKDKGGWQVVDVVFLVQMVFTLKILNSVQSIKVSNYPNSCFVKFVNGQLFGQATSKGEIPNLE